jgi:hypothetical protein
LVSRELESDSGHSNHVSDVREKQKRRLSFATLETAHGVKPKYH